jgi:hypothetical protein
LVLRATDNADSVNPRVTREYIDGMSNYRSVTKLQILFRRFIAKPVSAATRKN